MRLVVSGYYGYGNTGDEAILAGMLRSLRAERGDLEVIVLSGDPARTEREHGVAAVPRTSPVAVAQALRRSDGLISGGGGLLQDRTSPRPVAYYTGITQLARFLGRPYVIYAQGLGPIQRWPNRRLAAMALRGAASCSLRDEGSIELARALGVRRRIDLVPDPALALDPPRAAGDPHLLVAVRSWPSQVPYLDLLREALRRLATELPVVALPMQPDADLVASRAVVDGIPGSTVAGGAGDLEAQLRAIGGASVVLGMRLHALVLAAAATIPAVAFSYDPKVDAFARRAGQPVIGNVDRPIDPEAIVEAVHTALQRDVGEYAARVDAMRADLQGTARSALAAIEAKR